MIEYVTEPVVKVRQLSKVINAGSRDLVALDDVSCEVHRGEMVALMGPAGSGKSTLLSILGLMDLPTSGHYWFAGHDMGALNRVEQVQVRNARIGLYFQQFRLLPRLSVAQNVALPLAYGRLSESARMERARVALDRVGMAGWSLSRPTELTPIQQERVALARALVNHPSLLLVDEPIGTRDVEMRTEMLRLLRSLNREDGLTIVAVTDAPEVAQQMDRVVGLRDGRICPDVLYGFALGQVLRFPASRARIWCN